MMSDAADRREETIEAFLMDPIVRLLMQADNVDEVELRAMLDRVSATLLEQAELVTIPATTGVEEPSLLIPPRRYRPGVGIILFNEKKQIFVGRRIDVEHEAWQMPQGGIEPRETPGEAVFRELREELGTGNAEIIAKSNGWFRYDLPSELMGIAWDGKWDGQEQQWFVLRFRGVDADINVATEHPEFCDWRWVEPAELPRLIVPFKQQLYQDVLSEFRILPSNSVHR